MRWQPPLPMEMTCYRMKCTKKTTGEYFPSNSILPSKRAQLSDFYLRTIYGTTHYPNFIFPIFIFMTNFSKSALCSWSGGKDSCFALLRAVAMGYTPRVLLNVLNEEGKISRSHGIPSAILQKQAEAAGLPIHMISSSWQDYEKNFTAALSDLKDSYDLSYAVFGDIDLQPHRDWEEKVCSNAGLEAVLPLWQENRRQLVTAMLDSGIETIIVSCNETMGERFLGKKITPSLVDELEKIGVDACGENGEYHSLVLNCGLFRHPIQASVKATVLHEHYWFAMLE
jgi:diphthine-ammonia ligase